MLPTKQCISFAMMQRSSLIRSCLSSRLLKSSTCLAIATRRKKNTSNPSVSSLFQSVPIKANPDDINVGAELCGTFQKSDLLKLLVLFSQQKEVKSLALEMGLDNSLYQEAFLSFRRYCLETESLPVDLHVVISDILQGAGHIADLFPYFLRHAKQIFPHIECIDDLKQISDLRSPANWYPIARAKTRKIIFHAGPTNSGKTYHALERLMQAKSGMYCGPLKLLATEVFQKCNAQGTPCDLITGEERNFVNGEQTPTNHLSCTVEMASVNTECEVAVIDEIQLMRDPGRGWAWTRALLGIPADEIHVCGESAAIDLVRSVCLTAGEDVEVRNYKRLTDLTVEDAPLLSLKHVRPGDCIVCFSKNDIYAVSRELEANGIEIAVIYGSLPPNTKLAQASKFNDIHNSCNVLVATDAIGMGLNLHIRRIIFYSLIKPTVNDKGDKEMDTISVSSALQIAGRAGRYGTQWENGYVTTFKGQDLTTLRHLLSQTPESLTKAGLHPTADQIELYAYHLPKSTLSNLMDIFVSLCKVDDSLYFMCNIEDFKFLADMIQHVPLPLRARYVFCCAPINRRMPFVCTMFLKFTRQYSKNEPITFHYLCQHIGWPFASPKTILDLVHLEAVFDVLDIYLWLSYRFMDLFPDAEMVRDMQKELDALIQNCIIQLTRLLQRSETGVSSGVAAVSDEDNFEQHTRKQSYFRGQESNTVGNGKLTERLLAQGLLTPNMLQELRREWVEVSIHRIKVLTYKRIHLRHSTELWINICRAITGSQSLRKSQGEFSSQNKCNWKITV
ncbi:ATP-dependent RNA helicase SUV3 homolog, mitochondrial isoform X2 [Orussus abietinus]|uniref:ATP-dependent RNA helicase SUV3 homolog, mitochondrial isoform X2 n=1 Tax=Orussus abietinus TaxID=222816 RepID=UPI0006263E38|nr:ATP-dependent RNA helicase SUV3 homolog, mitochondrial isoform X2 [Orussus abietinus]